MLCFGVRGFVLKGGRGDSYVALLVSVRKWDIEERLCELKQWEWETLYSPSLTLTGLRSLSSARKYLKTESVICWSDA